MWKKYESIDGGYGYVKMISENYSKYTVNAEVILINSLTSLLLVTHHTIRFVEFFTGFDGLVETIGDYIDRYNKEPEGMMDIAFYCADGWSLWNADERIENPSKEEIEEYLKKHGVILDEENVTCEHREIVIVNTEGKRIENSRGREVDLLIRCDDCGEELFRISEYKRRIINLSKHY